MKTFCLITLIGVLQLICAKGIQAQPTQTQLHQIELMKGVTGDSKFNDYKKQLDIENFQYFINKGENRKIQDSKNLKVPKANQLKSALAMGEKLDSTIWESWDTITNQWVSMYKNEYAYDTKGNQTLWIENKWNNSTSKWVGISKYEYTYDANRNQILYIVSYWDDATSRLVFYQKDESTYNANGNNTVVIYYWDITTNQWVGNTKVERTYDANGKCTLDAIYNWDKNNSQWIAYNKWEYTYDVNGESVLDIYYMWINDQFVPFDKCEYNYDTHRNINIGINYEWDFNNSNWVVYSKTEITYDANGECTLDVHYVWNENNSQWIADHTSEYTFDTNGNLIVYIESYWDNAISQLGFYQKYEFTYNANGEDTWVIYYWDIITNQWIAYYKCTYYYSEHSMIFNPEKLNVYPNPASDYAVFHINNISDSAKIEIFDNQGKKVLEQKLPVTGQISISHLATGLYLYRITNSRYIYTGKIIVL